MTLKNRDVGNVANVCWQRVPDRQQMGKRQALASHDK